MRVSFDFRGHQVLVTGGTSGIGLSIAGSFADAGARVVITGTRATAADYDADLSQLEYHRCVLNDPPSIDRVADALDRLDVLVNNAGVSLREHDEWDPDTFSDALEINLAGPFRLASRCQPLLASSAVDGGPSIVNVASLASFFGIAAVPGYGAAKAGLVQMTKSMAVQWARDGVRVNAVAPGIVATRMTAALLASEDRTERQLARTPIGRLGVPEDIAPVVQFLASAAAGYVTGQTLVVDGGYSVQG